MRVVYVYRFCKEILCHYVHEGGHHLRSEDVYAFICTQYSQIETSAAYTESCTDNIATTTVLVHFYVLFFFVCSFPIAAKRREKEREREISEPETDNIVRNKLWESSTKTMPGEMGRSMMRGYTGRVLFSFSFISLID